MITVGGPADPLAHHEVVRVWGHDDFILCLGYKGECIKEYFLNYNEALSNDFVLSNGGRDVELLGERHLGLDDHVRRHRRAVDDRRAAARGRAAPRRRRVLPRHLRRRPDRRAAAGHDRAAARRRGRPASSSRCARCSTRTSSTRTPTASSARSRTSQQADVWINGGFFVFRRDILDYINPGEELVDRAVPAADRARRAARVPLRGLLGADGHDQGQAAARRARRERHARRGAARRPRCDSTVADAPASSLLAASRRSAACSRSARTPTTSRSAAARRCSRSRGRSPTSR